MYVEHSDVMIADIHFCNSFLILHCFFAGNMKVRGGLSDQMVG